MSDRASSNKSCRGPPKAPTFGRCWFGAVMVDGDRCCDKENVTGEALDGSLRD